MTSAQTAQILLALLGCWGAAVVATAVGLLLPRTRTAADRTGLALAVLGWLVLLGLIGALWITLGRPPLRTLGETRLWYAAALVGFGLGTELALGTTVARLPALLLGLLFLTLDALTPDALDRTLRPALASPLFVPHVVAYLASYAALGLSAGIAGWEWLQAARQRRPIAPAPALLAWRFLLLGLPLLTVGMALGAVWAKEAWGHYWAWDPKETWALITWSTYVVLLHQARHSRWSPGQVCRALTLAFAVVLVCWFAVAHLPSAEVSVHTYAQD